MGKNNETTTKFKADISNLKAGITQANTIIKSANAEFKNATAGMDNWSKSADGLEAKITQLDKTFSAQETIVKNLKEQYRLVCQQEGENSASAQQLADKINNAEAKLKNTESQLTKYKDALAKAQTPTAELTTKIETQTKDLERLKDKYTDVVIKEGENSESAKDLAGKISSLSGELKENKEKLQDAKDKAEDLDKSFDDAGEAAEESAQKSKDAANGGFTVMKGTLANLASEAIHDVVDGLKEITTESEAAYSGFQALTGINAHDMSKYKDSIDNLYNKGIGDGFDDISQAMATVKQITGEIDPSKLEDMTENAILLRDVFDMDISESIRASKMLVDQFGTSFGEAYSLIVQGAQKGLNKNGDLLDTINEYGVHYKQLGYNAEDFLNSLSNGTEAGTFSVDKLGDAMKEFGIRSKDTSATTTEGFNLIGLDADKMRKRFAKGGDTAKKATKETIEALFSLDDEVKQNQAGVDLFGTMWEDLGIDGVKALTNVQGDLKKTKNAMEEVKDIKYNDISTEVESLGRTAKTEILEPLLEEALPKIKDGINWIKRNMDDIIPLVGGVGAALTAAFAINKISNFKDSLENLLPSFKLISESADEASGTTGLGSLISVISAAGGPAGWAVLGAIAIGGIATAIFDITHETDPAIEAQQKLKESAEKVKEEYEKWKAAKDEAFQEPTVVWDNYNEMFEKLKSIVDKNGKIKSGYEEQATVLKDNLNEQLGTNAKIVKGTFQDWEKISVEMGKQLKIQKAQAFVSAGEESYSNALENQKEAWENYASQLKESERLQDGLSRAQKAKIVYETEGLEALKTKYKDIYDAVNISGTSIKTNLQTVVDSWNRNYEEHSKTLKESENAYLNYATTITNYENALSATTSGTADEMELATLKMKYGFIDAEIGSKESLDKQITNLEDNIEQTKKAIKNGTPGVTQAQLDEYNILLDCAKTELKKFEVAHKETGEKSGQGYVKGIDSEKENAKKAGGDLVKSAYDGATAICKEYNLSDVARDAIAGYLKEMKSGGPKAALAAANLGVATLTGITNSLDSHSPSRETAKLGGYAVSGYVNELKNSKSIRSVSLAATNLGLATLRGVTDSLDIHSPSRKMGKLAGHTVGGYVNKLLDLLPEVARAAKAVANSVLKEFDNDLNIKANIGFNLKSLDNIKRSIQTNPVQQNYERLSPTQSKGNTINNYTQNNYSPKALNNAEIYRQTKNALAYVKNKGW